MTLPTPGVTTNWGAQLNDHAARLDLPPERAAEAYPRTHWEAPTAFPLDLATLPVGGPETALAVYANHGRWVVECPDCHGAQLATPADPRFLCNFCANASTGGTWRPVAWPPNRAAIETLLEVRPNEENRNWLPGETEALLDAENRVHLDPPTPPDVVTTLRGR